MSNWNSVLHTYLQQHETKHQPKSAPVRVTLAPEVTRKDIVLFLREVGAIMDRGEG